MLPKFRFNGQTIRACEDFQRVTWFHYADVCKALGRHQRTKTLQWMNPVHVRFLRKSDLLGMELTKGFWDERFIPKAKTAGEGVRFVDSAGFWCLVMSSECSATYVLRDWAASFFLPNAVGSIVRQGEFDWVVQSQKLRGVPSGGDYSRQKRSGFCPEEIVAALEERNRRC